MTRYTPTKNVPEYLVRHSGFHFVCVLTHLGYKCGYCLRGNLGFMPKSKALCRVCKAKVR